MKQLAFKLLTIFALFFCTHQASAQFLIPTAFTPNNDGINDLFQIMASNVESLSLVVCDNFGDEIFSTTDFYESWDGNLPNGTMAAAGTYLAKWELNISGQVYEGSTGVTLLAYSQDGCIVGSELDYLFASQATGTGVFDNNLPSQEVFCESTSNQITASSETVTLFPNPAVDFLQLRGLSKNLNRGSIISTDARILESVIIVDNTIDVSRLPQGAYILLLELDERRVELPFVK